MQYTASAVIPSKKPGTPVKKIVQIKISIYGLPGMILNENEVEFVNEQFVNISEVTNIVLKLISVGHLGVTV